MGTVPKIVELVGTTSEIIEFVFGDPQSCDKLLQEIDDVAQHYGSYEYGLPLHDEGVKAQIREALVRWLFRASRTSKSTFLVR